MQALTVGANRNAGHKVLPDFGIFRKRSSGVSNLCMLDRSFCGRSHLGSLVMGAQLCSRFGEDTIFRSKARARSIRVQASDGDVEDVGPDKLQAKSSGSVLPYVGVACLGAILFGYHLGSISHYPMQCCS